MTLLYKTQLNKLLRALILIIVICTLVSMIRFPQTEGRAAGLDLVSIYKDPFIIYMYIASIPFFVMLFQAFKLLGYFGKNKITFQATINTLRNIKYCALAVIGFLIVAIIYIRLFAHGDDPAGPTMLGFVVIIVFSLIAALASVYQKRLQKGLK